MSGTRRSALSPSRSSAADEMEEATGSRLICRPGCQGQRSKSAPQVFEYWQSAPTVPRLWRAQNASLLRHRNGPRIPAHGAGFKPTARRPRKVPGRAKDDVVAGRLLPAPAEAWEAAVEFGGGSTKPKTSLRPAVTDEPSRDWPSPSRAKVDNPKRPSPESAGLQ